MKISIKLLVATLLFSAVSSCGTRKITLGKDLDINKSSTKIESNYRANNNLVVNTKSNILKNESDLELTISREYQLDHNGNPYLSKETLANKKKDKISNEVKESNAKSNAEVKNADKGHTSEYGKEVKKHKEVDADKSVANNLGGAVVVLIIVVVAFIIVKSKLR